MQPIATGQKQPLPTRTGSCSITDWVEDGWLAQLCTGFREHEIITGRENKLILIQIRNKLFQYNAKEIFYFLTQFN
jgi:hypothetical protein